MVRHDYMGCLENVEVSSCKKTVDTHVAELVGNYSWSNIYTRPVWVLSMDRVRSGVNQWADRGQVLYITNTPPSYILYRFWAQTYTRPFDYLTKLLC